MRIRAAVLWEQGQPLSVEAAELDAPGPGEVLVEVKAAGIDVVATHAFARGISVVLAGNDEAHPWAISEELSKLLPNCEFVAEWKAGDALTAARARVKDFLAKHTPAQ